MVSRKTYSVNFIAPIFGHYLSTPAKSGMAVPRQMRTAWNRFNLQQHGIVTDLLVFASFNSPYLDTGWESLAERRKNKKLSLMYKILNNEAPLYLSDLLPRRVEAASNYNLRNSQNFEIPFTRLCSFETSFFPSR